VYFMARFPKPRSHLLVVLLLLSVMECAYGQERYRIGLEVDGHCFPKGASSRWGPASPHDFVAASPRLPAANFSLVDWRVGVSLSKEFPKAPNACENPPQGGVPTIAILSPAAKPHEERFHWWPALGESFLFLVIENGTRMAFDPPSRDALRGKFWDDYVASVQSIKSWDDGNPFFVNYIGHPMQGAITGFIQIQNDPRGRALQFAWSKPYWTSRMKAMAWSAVYSTYFEIGFPLSEAALGNLGVDKSRGAQNGYVDLVVTPILGTAWLIGEDLADRYWIVPYEKKHSGKTGRALMRSVLNPTRSFANVLRFKVPWHRDGRAGVLEFDLPTPTASISPAQSSRR
jgi:hypothetical protein